MNAGLTNNLEWGGGGLTFTLNNNRQSTTSLTTLYNPAYNTSYSVQYTQPLMRGFSTDNTRNQIVVTRLNQQISELQLQSTIVNTLADVRNAYWNLVFALEAVDVAQQSVHLAEQLVTDNNARVQIGTMAPIDVVQARSQAATEQQRLIQAQSASDQAELALKRLIVSGATDANWLTAIVPSDRPWFAPEPIDVPALIQQALAGRIDLARAKKSVQASDSTLQYLRNQRLPQVDLVTRYGLIGLGGTQYQRSGTGITGDILSSSPGGYGNALSSLFGGNYPTWTVSLNLSMPLGKSAAEAAAARGRLQVDQADAQVKQIELQIVTEITNAARTATGAVQSVEAARVVRDLAEQTLDAEQRKFQVGMSTNFNVIQAQRDLAAVRNAELQSVLTYRKALVELDRLSKTSLQTANITVVGGAS